VSAVVSADVVLWGSVAGAAYWDAERSLAFFEYTPAFLRAPVQIAPLTMPRSPEIFSFPELPRRTFKGLPGLLADSLPDKFGNAVIDRWLAERGRSAESFSPIERLCYAGSRGMGALEFRPSIGERNDQSRPLDISDLVELANLVLSQRSGLVVQLHSDSDDKRSELDSILSVGTSAGGARAKAVVAWNQATGELRSGQTKAPDGFAYWLLKFDGVSENADKELHDPKGFGRLEYAYHLMAREAGIDMSECRLLEEGGRAHFMTKRFDRTDEGAKLHMQTLCALAHYDFNLAGAYGYEQAFMTIKRLRMDALAERDALEQSFRRMVFNVMARNQDDHTKNIAFLMDRSGAWRLAPAYDLTYAYNPAGEWTSSHQMTVNGKRDGFAMEDLLAAATAADLRPPRAKAIIEEVAAAVASWLRFAEEAGVSESWATAVASAHRLTLKP
jgi:serine/threonine-protein kinase HipA